VALYFVLPQVLPRAKGLAALFAGILHAPSAGVDVFRGKSNNTKPIVIATHPSFFSFSYSLELSRTEEHKLWRAGYRVTRRPEKTRARN
jgi:hypothetical protein